MSNSYTLAELEQHLDDVTDALAHEKDARMKSKYRQEISATKVEIEKLREQREYLLRIADDPAHWDGEKPSRRFGSGSERDRGLRTIERFADILTPRSSASATSPGSSR